MDGWEVIVGAVVGLHVPPLEDLQLIPNDLVVGSGDALVCFLLGLALG